MFFSSVFLFSNLIHVLLDLENLPLTSIYNYLEILVVIIFLCFSILGAIVLRCMVRKHDQVFIKHKKAVIYKLLIVYVIFFGVEIVQDSKEWRFLNETLYECFKTGSSFEIPDRLILLHFTFEDFDLALAWNAITIEHG